jgi:hypothetical protein
LLGHLENDLPPFYLFVDPLSSGFGVDLLFLLIEDSQDLLLCVCEVLVALVGAVEVKLAYLVSLEGDFDAVDYLDEFVHAEHVLTYFAFVEGHQDKIMDIFFFVL